MGVSPIAKCHKSLAQPSPSLFHKKKGKQDIRAKKFTTFSSLTLQFEKTLAIYFIFMSHFDKDITFFRYIRLQIFVQ